MRIFPKNNMIFVQQHKQVVEDKSEGGIVLPKSAQKQQQTNDGFITHVCTKDTPHQQVYLGDYEVGQRVIFGEYAGAPIVVDGETYLAMKESDIIAVLEPENRKEYDAENVGGNHE
ncbi:MAG: co-chaperone GroES [Planctomycetes bacterium]|nr:co-chaperone GroES [Planctomycetota bacterium]